VITRRSILKLAALAVLHPALSWAGPAVPRTPHGYRELRPGVFVAWLEPGEQIEGPVKILMTMGAPAYGNSLVASTLDLAPRRTGYLFSMIKT
jgi:hypothetical protein